MGDKQDEEQAAAAAGKGEEEQPVKETTDAAVNDEQEDQEVEEDNTSETQPLTSTVDQAEPDAPETHLAEETAQEPDTKPAPVDTPKANNGDIELEKIEEPTESKIEAETGVEKETCEQTTVCPPLAPPSENTDVEAAQPNGTGANESKMADGKHLILLQIMKKKEVLLCFIGGLAFLIGLIMIIVGLMVMQGKCDRHYWKPEQHGNGDSPESRPLFKTSMSGAKHAHEHHQKHHHNEVSYTFDDKNKTHDGHLNLALHKDAYMSSVALSEETSAELNASLAVDGVHSNKVKRDACAQTGVQSRPYWYVDLGSTHPVKRVKIIIPGDCCIGELHDFEVRVGQSEDLTQNTVCKPFLGTALKVAIDIECDEALFGRFVSIQMLGDDLRLKDRLILCEVMVYSR